MRLVNSHRLKRNDKKKSMLQITHGSTQGLADVERFIETINGLDQSDVAAARSLFDSDAEIIVTRAPGRLDVMGGIADYSGSLVLQLPIREAALVALQPAAERTLRIVSFGAEANHRAVSLTMPLAEFERDGEPVDYLAARAYFEGDPATRWAAYAAGAFLVLMRERQIRFNSGARLLIDSSVPEGKGVSSSAAIEVAVMQAVAAAFDIAIDARQTALLCQKVENLIVGAPCGVMDQMTASCGEANRLLALLCQPAELQGAVQISETLAVWGIDSGIRHSVSGADYGSVRVGAFMGYRMMAEMAGLFVEAAGEAGRVKIADSRWQGYVANVTPSEFEQSYRAGLPERLAGRDFLARFDGTTDAVTRVEPERDYAVRMPTAHPIYEHFRVRAFAELLMNAASERGRELLGEFMFQSHASYSVCGLGSEATDLLVKRVREAGPLRGLYGAKITGGGSGGTVAVLGRADAQATVMEIAERYAGETGRAPQVFSGSSPGAAAFGHLRLGRR
ncbi:MAG: galactokinase [Blastocatellia bacterium]